KEVFFRLGILYSEALPDTKRAVVSFNRVLEHEPSNRVALEKLAALYQSAGDGKNALAAIGRLAQIEPDPTARATLFLDAARIQESMLHQPRAALDLLRRALAVDPMRMEAITAIARHFERQGDAMSARVHLDTSINALRAAAERRPLDPAPYHGLFD